MKAYFFAILSLLLFCKNAFAVDYYSVKFPNDTTVYGCGASIPSSYPAITMIANCNFNVGVSYNDQVFYTDASQTCGKVLRRFRLIYWCDYNSNLNPFFIPNPSTTNVGPTVIGNTANRGHLDYTQMIQFVDNVPPVFINCPTGPVTFCDYTTNNPNQYNNNYTDRCEGPVTLTSKVSDVCSKSNVTIAYRLFLDLDGNGTMETLKSSSDPTAWPIEKTISNDTLRSNIKFPVGFGLPYGTHKVEWIANDNCGNSSICKYEFIVKDCAAPTVVCCNGLSINIMQSGMITLWAADFLLYTTDNCTPTAQIKSGIRKAGTGSGFPVNSPSVTFTCAELGNRYVEIWAQDAYGNADFCQTFVKVQDNWGVCSPPTPPTNLRNLAGRITDDQQHNLANLPVSIISTDSSDVSKWLIFTDSLGKYAFQSDSICDLTLSILQDSVQQHHGINTMDVLLAANAIVGAYTPTPTRKMAIDLNNDHILDDADLIKMIESVIAPTNAGAGDWRFVPRTHVRCACPTDSLIAADSLLHDYYLVQCVDSALLHQDFVAIAMGDIDGSARMDSTAFQSNNIQNRGSEKTRSFTTRKQIFKAGDILSVPLTTPDLDGLAAFQFTLGYDIATLDLQSVESGLVPSQWIGTYPSMGKIATSWHTKSGAIIGQKNLKSTAFTLVFKALQDGTLEQSMTMNGDIAAPEAYNDEQETQPIELIFETTKPQERSFGAINPDFFSTLSPNPNNGNAMLDFHQSEAGEVSFTLTDLAGRVLRTERIYFEAGAQVYRFQCDLKGVFVLRVEGALGSLVERVVVR
jgi:hypothetical protein